jgi:hypothetical protein
MTRILGVYLEQSYSIYHSITLLVELSKIEGVEVVIICSSRNRKVIIDLWNSNDGCDFILKTVRPWWFISLPLILEIKLSYRKSIFRKYRALLSQQDGIVCAIYDDLEIKRHIDTTKTKLVFADHGVSNRPYSFDLRIKDFDCFFLTGYLEETARKKLGQLEKSNYVMTGYLKFDVKSISQKKKQFENNKKIIIYNPHWDKSLSSFDKFGLSLLDFVAGSKDYNLIFSPHKLLLTRNLSLRLKLKKYSHFENIIIDSSSELCNDLSYAKLAHLYIGDVSSQSSEFIAIDPRPCMFLRNNNNLKIGDFVSWDFGDVISEVSSWKKTIDMMITNFDKKYKVVQEMMVPQLFYKGNDTSSEIAANWTAKFLN